MKKLKASAIYYALFLSIIFALILGGLILFAGFNKNFAARMEVQQLLINNAHSGLAYAQTNFKELKNNVPLQLRLFNTGIDSVVLRKQQWGAFTVIKSTANHRKTQHTKIAFYGAVQKASYPNLYMADNGRPLSLCGETRIEGNAYLPKAGVKRAYISGKNYQGSQLIYGNKKQAERSLPILESDFLTTVLSFQGPILPWNSDADSVVASFADQPRHYVSDGSLSLQNIVINGQIIIEAKDSIFIGNTAKIDQAIIKANCIYIQSGFSGQVQVFAGQRVVLEEGVQLTYPSVVGVVEEKTPIGRSSEIEIASNAQVLGTVFLISKQPDFRKLPTLKIATDAEVDGLVYCQGKTELKGIIKGSLYTNKFYLKTASSAYENHILDGQLLDQLPEGFVVASLLDQTEELKQLAWLK